MKTLVALLAVVAVTQLALGTHAPDPTRAAGPATAASAAAPLPERLSDSAFAALSRELSEPAGFFDSDNLVSNEASYLHVLDGVRRLGTRGGVYVGVGPDQGFSYIAAVRPRIAFAVDIRRDNLLVHLLYKAAFEQARNRLEYLALFFGRPLPDDVAAWDDRPLDAIVAWLDAHPPTAESRAAAEGRLLGGVARLPLALSPADTATLRRFHRTYVDGGLDIRFTSLGRPPRPYYPTYRQLLLERDRAGRPSSYLATAEAFAVVQTLQRRNLVVPLVGDLAGATALPALGRWIGAHGEGVSCLYASNVEFYLARDGTLDAFGRNLAALPRARNAVLVRSVFRGASWMDAGHHVPGYLSTQLAAPLDSVAAEFARGGYRSYHDVVTRHALAP